MENFRFQCATKIIFGKNTESFVGKEVGKLANKILLHYGGGSIKKYGLYDKIIKLLKEESIEIVELAGVKPNPRLSMVGKGIELCRKNKVELILAVGGGSVIDSAKAISIGVNYNGNVWDFYTGKERAKKALPVGVVLTIPAAGSESSPGSVITKEEGSYKRPYVDNIIRPRFAILNPEISYTLPPYQTACGVVDIMAHIMERYFTTVSNVDLTDRLCEAALKTMIKNAPVVLKKKDDYNARAEIMWTGTVAHTDLLETGRIGDWGSHDIEHELSGIYDIAHGAGLAVIFPAWMKYVYKKDIQKFIQFAVRVWNIEYDFDNKGKMVFEGIKRLKEFFKQIGMPVSLKELNINSDRFDEMSRKATENGPLGNFMKLSKEDVFNIYKLSQ